MSTPLLRFKELDVPAITSRRKKVDEEMQSLKGRRVEIPGFF